MNAEQHSVLGPSHAETWMGCPGSVAMCADIPNSTSIYAEDGKQAHKYGEWLLGDAKAPVPFDVDKEMVGHVSVYTNAIRHAAEGKALFVEQRIPLEKYTTEVGGKGTADAVIIDVASGAVEVHDLKYGRGVVVDAEDNKQLMLYALGAVSLVEQLYVDVVTSVKLVIHQPRRDHYSEWIVSREALLAFGVQAAIAGKLALSSAKGENLHPSEKACLRCPAKATCPALAAEAHAAVFGEFDVVKQPSLENVLPSADKLGLIETWLAAVREYINSKLQKGETVPGWKLVMGRQGNRSWNAPGKVEELCTALRIKKGDSHDLKLKSVAQMEEVVSDKKWPLFAELISRSDAKPTMAAESDKRAAVKSITVEEFDLIN